MGEEYDAYPNSGRFYFQTAKTQERKQAVEIAEVLDQLPLLKKIVDHFDERIAFYKSIDAIDVDIDKDPLTFQKVHAANKLIVQNLEQERAFLQSEVDKAAKQ